MLIRHPLRSLVIAAVVLVGLAIGADRVANHVAEGRIAAVLQSDAHLAHKPTVTVHGFPFLTQAVGGTYDRIEVKASDLFDSVTGLHGSTGSVSTVNFDGVHLPVSKALSGDVDEIRVDRVTGSAVVAFSDVEKASGVPGLRIGAVVGQPDQARLSESVDVAGVSATAEVTARVSVVGNGVKLEPVDVSLPAGVSLPAAVLDQVRSRAGFTVTVPGLPRGVRLTGVSVGPAGVTVAVRADDITLTR
jgi:hypothetical protein